MRTCAPLTSMRYCCPFCTAKCDGFQCTSAYTGNVVFGFGGFDVPLNRVAIKLASAASRVSSPALLSAIPAAGRQQEERARTGSPPLNEACLQAAESFGAYPGTSRSP